MDGAGQGDEKRVESLTGFARQLPWSLLQTQWLDVPIGEGAHDATLTWGAFSETFDACLRGVSLHVVRRVDDRARLECVVTQVLVDNLDVLVSQLADRDKLHRLLTAADLLLRGGGLPPTRTKLMHARAEMEA
jgi:hypothetical protein